MVALRKKMVFNFAFLTAIWHFELLPPSAIHEHQATSDEIALTKSRNGGNIN